MLLCLPFTDDTLKGHFDEVDLQGPPLSVAVKLLCLQHVREVGCREIQGCEVSVSVRRNLFQEIQCVHMYSVSGT